ncbi:MAG: short-chain fatty acids transporter [Bradymonadia bacterium]|jgi:short-chain fatty acids transporter
MIQALGNRLQAIASRIVPEPFVLAVVLTAVVGAVGAFRLSSQGETDVLWTLADGWATEFMSAGLLAFALKMALILVTGHALALSPPVQSFVDRVARVPNSASTSAALVALVACASSLIHWGLGAIVGALLAREIGRNARERGVRLHYPLLGAAAYSGFAVWHGGLSGSAPVTVANDGHFLAEQLSGSYVDGVISIGDTVGGTLNLVITGTLIIAIPLVCALLTPKDKADCLPPDESQLTPLPDLRPSGATTLIERIQNHPALGMIFGAGGMLYVIAAIGTGRTTFGLDSVILLFLFSGLALQGSLTSYSKAVADGARGAGAIVLQFPFYFGMLGLMKAGGLITAFSNALVSVSTQTTFPLFAFLSAGAVNFFVPSGGGQWAVQGEILLTAGDRLGVDPITTIMAFSYGDAWTNLLQPFWALPLLGIMGLKAKDIIGYTAVILLIMAVIVGVGLLLLG